MDYRVSVVGCGSSAKVGAASCLVLDRLGQASGAPLPGRQAAHLVERGTDEDLERHHAGHRIARQPEYRLAADLPEDQWLAGANGHLRKVDATHAGNAIFHDIEVADRDAA